MKPTLFYVLKAAVLLMLFALPACSDGNDNQNVYNDVVVSVRHDGNNRCYLLTDKDIVLRPTNVADYGNLDNIMRVAVSFVFNDADVNAGNISADREYAVTLVGNAYNIPTFSSFVDVASEQYKSGGNDSLSLLNKQVRSLSAGNSLCYISNGFLNIFPSFYYSLNVPVLMALFYDSGTDVSDKGAKLHFYFNNQTTGALELYEGGMVSMVLPMELFNALASKGIEDADTVRIEVVADELNSSATRVYKVPLEELKP